MRNTEPSEPLGGESSGNLDVVLDNGDYVNPARFGDDGTPGPADIEPLPPARDPYLSEALKYLIVIGALTLFAIVIGLVVLALL